MSLSRVALSPEHFTLLQRVIRTVARNNRLNPEDAEDFSQTVHVRLLERNYDVFNSYEGRSSLATYLTVVVTRQLLDWRNATRGKWRPSARAVRLGAEAVALERLIHRDGLTRAEAVSTLASRRAITRKGEEVELQSLADQLPVRLRRSFVRDVADDVLGRLDFEDPVLAREDGQRRHAVRRALREACASLGAEERQLLALRYGRAFSVRAIGVELRTDPKPLYRKLDRVLKALRHHLGALGVDRVHVEQPA